MTEKCPTCSTEMIYLGTYLWLCEKCKKHYRKQLIPDNSSQGFRKVWMVELTVSVVQVI